MRFGYIRAAVYAAVVLGTAVALTFIPALPESRPAEILFSQAAAAVPTGKVEFDTLGAGERLHRVLQRSGLSDTAAIRAIQASSQKIDARRLQAGMPITVKADAPDSAPSEVVFQLGVDRFLKIKRTGDTWEAVEEKLEWEVDTIAVSGTIESNLYAAVDASASEFIPSKGVRAQLTEALAEVYDFKVDMSRELQKGDRFTVLAERATLSTGATRINRVLASKFTLSGSTLNAVGFKSARVGGGFFDEQGRSLTEQFLKTPIAFKYRISSRFGSRRHPVLGTVRNHKGTDYAAAPGTPIRSIGDGVVIRSGWNGGYGNAVDIRHSNGYVTRYGHMLRSPSVKLGQRVTMGQTIGLVGSTGLSTGPHLHFEVIVNGVQRNSLTAFRNVGGDPIPAAERDSFQFIRDQLLSRLEGIAVNTAIALQGGTDR